MQKLIQVGILLLCLGIILIFIGSFTATKTSEKSNIRTAGGIFIGPFPLFGFASDKKMFYALLVVMVILTIMFLIFNKIR